VEKTTQRGAVLFALFTKYYLGDQMKNEMGGECNTYGGGKVYTGFWWGNLKERDHLEDLGVDGG